MAKPFRRQQGFSFIEVIITLFLIAVMLVLYEAALNTIKLSRNAKDQEIALRIASQEMETLRAAGYTALPADGTSFTDPQMAKLPAGSSGIVNVIDDDPNRTRQVKVTVTWREANTAADHTVVLETLLAKVGGLK